MNLNMFHRVGNGHCPCETKQHVDMIVVPTNNDWDMPLRLHQGSNVGKYRLSEVGVEPRSSVLGAKDAMNDNLGKRLGHRAFILLD